jgi:predicted MFS family arabinose efflux permease
MPAYAAHVVHTDARGLGLLMAASGIGALGGAFTTALLVPQRRSLLWTGATVVLAAGTCALGGTSSLYAALPILAAMGLATLTFMGSSNILLQTLAPDELRGRVISLYAMVVLGLVPAGSLLIGSIASIVGLRETFLGAGLVTAAFAVWVYLAHPKVRAV